MVPLVLLAGIVTLWSTDVEAQSGSGLDEWLRFRVFTTTREEVEKELGQTGKTSAHFVRYKNARGSVYVDYSKGDCQSASPVWNVPAWTVIEVSYSPHVNPPKLAQLLSTKSKFNKRSSGDVAGHVEYYDDERGISIVYDEELKEVRNITIRPSVQAQKNYDCSLSNTKATSLTDIHP